MKLYLSSYLLGNKIDEIKKWIKENNNKILLICNARDAKIQDEKEKNKILQNIKMLEDVGFQVKILDLKQYFNNKDTLEKDIANYSSFCVIGGNVFVLRQAMKLSGFDNFLRKISNNDKYLYIGYSAGSCVLSNSLKGFDLVDDPINPYNDDDVIYEGIGLINYNIAPHYKSNHKESEAVEKVVEYFNTNNIKYKALRDGDVLIEYL